MATHNSHRTERNRLLFFGLLAAAFITMLGLMISGFPAVAAVAFFILVGTATALRGIDDSMFDERDTEIVRTASSNTIAVLSLSSAIFFPTMTLLTALGYTEWPRWLTIVGVFDAVLFVVWLSTLLLARYRR